MKLVRQVWPRRYLLFGGAPLLNVEYGEPKPKEHVDIGCEGPMLLDHTFGKPICPVPF